MHLHFINDKEYSSQLSDYEDDLDDLEDKLSDMEDSYYEQFSNMETALAKLNSTVQRTVIDVRYVIMKLRINEFLEPIILRAVLFQHKRHSIMAFCWQ